MRIEGQLPGDIPYDIEVPQEINDVLKNMDQLNEDQFQKMAGGLLNG